MIQVNVESTFSAGMVVSYTDRATGVDYIGALLPTTPYSCLLPKKRKLNVQCCLHSAESHFANPLVCVHDHQYTQDLPSSVNAVLKNVPKQTLLNWDTCNSSSTVQSRRPMESSTTTSIPKTYIAVCDNPCSGADSTELFNFDGTYYRSAKQTAYEKLKFQREIEILNESVWSSLEGTYDTSHRKRKKVQSRRKNKPAGSSRGTSLHSVSQKEVGSSTSSHQDLNSSSSNPSEESVLKFSNSALINAKHLGDHHSGEQQSSSIKFNTVTSGLSKPEHLELKPFSLRLAKVTSWSVKDPHDNE